MTARRIFGKLDSVQNCPRTGNDVVTKVAGPEMIREMFFREDPTRLRGRVPDALAELDRKIKERFAEEDVLAANAATSLRLKCAA